MGKKQGSPRFRGVTLVDPTKMPVNYRPLKRRSLVSKIDELMAEARKEFDALTEEAKSLSENRSKIDQRIGQINARQLELRGSYAAYEKLKQAEGGPAPVEAPADEAGKVS